MTTLHLIRHGANDALKARRLAGRDTILGLNAEGRAQAERRAESMRDLPLSAILSSPLPRCRQTAEPLAKLLNLQIEIRDELLELDFGQWTGQHHAELNEDPRWNAYNAFRAGNAAPGGETLAEVRARMLRVAVELTNRFPEAHVAIVGHGDPLASLIMQVLGMPDDAITRLLLRPCSWTTLDFGPEGAKLVRLLNESEEN